MATQVKVTNVTRNVIKLAWNTIINNNTSVRSLSSLSSLSLSSSKTITRKQQYHSLVCDCIQSTSTCIVGQYHQHYQSPQRQQQFQQRRHKFKLVGERETGEPVQILDDTYYADEWTNVPNKVLSLIGRDLYRTPGNPISLIADSLRIHFSTYHCHVFPNPVVDLWRNFDSILVPEDHISRSRTDTYYVNASQVLRGHTSAHQFECFEQCFKRNLDGRFMIIGDVYRRDEVNRTHHAAFHQCEVVRLFRTTDTEMIDAGIREFFDTTQAETDQTQIGLVPSAVKIVEQNLKHETEQYIKRLFGDELQLRWVDAYFPFTHPSWELEILNPDTGEWMEILGCGVIRHSILTQAGQQSYIGWALGMGLERLAMLYYSIPDIRLFWTRDTGFTHQFATAQPFERITYRPISAYAQKVFDISFWLPTATATSWSANDVHAIILECGGELVEQVYLMEQFTHPRTSRVSNMYRIVYRSMERPLTTAEVNVIHKKVEQALVQQLQVEIR